MTPEVLSPSYFAHFETLIQKLESRPGTVLNLAFSDHGRFACSSCAACCDRDWGIVVTEEYAQHWLPIWNADADPRFHDPFVKQELPAGLSTPERYRTIRKQKGSTRCLFLDPDNKCYIHRVYGEKSKPKGCQAYPMYIQTQFNGYSAMFLQKSCVSAPGLMIKDPKIYYFLMETTPNDLPPIPKGAEAKAFPIHDFYRFLGLVLDVLDVSSGSLLERYGSIHSTLTRLFVSPTAMSWKQLYEHAIQDVKSPPDHLSQDIKQRTQKVFQALVKDCFPEVISQPVYLDMQSEKAQLNQYLWVYLRQKLVTQSYEAIGQKYFDVLTHQVIIMCFLQMGLLYTRYVQGSEPFSVAHFEQALNQVEKRLGHQHNWIETLGIDQLPPEEAVALFQGLSQLTFQ